MKIEQTSHKTVSGILFRADDEVVVLRLRKSKSIEIRKESVERLEARPFKPAWQRGGEGPISSPKVTWEKETAPFKPVYRRLK